MKTLFTILAALLLPTVGRSGVDAAHEASMNFDKKNIVPFLKSASQLFEGGFGSAEVKKVAAMMETLKRKEEKELTFQATFKGSAVALRVRLFMDDIDAVDLYMFSSADVAARLNDLMRKFAEDHGL